MDLTRELKQRLDRVKVERYEYQGNRNADYSSSDNEIELEIVKEHGKVPPRNASKDDIKVFKYEQRLEYLNQCKKTLNDTLQNLKKNHDLNVLAKQVDLARKRQ